MKKVPLVCGLFAIIATNFVFSQNVAGQSIMTLRAEGLSALVEEDRKAAIAAADKIVKNYPEDTRAMQLAADIYLRAGKTKWAVRMFDRYLEDDPDAMPELWQRGIALYFTNDFKAAAKQFEVHRKVNPNDVENAAWHFLCVAKAQGFKEAKKNVLPAPDDPRIPMKEVLEMLKSGDTDAVNASVNKTRIGTPKRESASFYGDFYLGLYADAKGEKKEALKYMMRSAVDAPHNYMGDIARVYADFLKGDLDQ